MEESKYNIIKTEKVDQIDLNENEIWNLTFFGRCMGDIMRLEMLQLGSKLKEKSEKMLSLVREVPKSHPTGEIVMCQHPQYKDSISNQLKDYKKNSDGYVMLTLISPSGSAIRKRKLSNLDDKKNYIKLMHMHTIWHGIVVLVLIKRNFLGQNQD